MQNQVVIEACGLTKRYTNLTAVKDLSLNIRRSEIYGFLGLNGAGKTTTIRMLLGMIKPSRGTVTILGTGVQPGQNAVWKKVGYMVEAPHAYPDLTVRENLEIFRHWHKLQDNRIVYDIIDRLGLTPWINRQARTLSLGNAQRLGLAKALIHQPDLLILDEPVNGLDPAGIVEVRHLLKELAEKHGVTVFISSHILSEVSKLATRIGVIHEGRLIKEISNRDLTARGQNRLAVTVRDHAAAQAVLKKAGFEPETLDTQSFIIRDEQAIQHPENVAVLLVQAGYPPVRLAVEQDELESYFLNLIAIEEKNHEPVRT